MRRAASTDENQQAIVAALTKAGASVTSLHKVGGGVPDLLVSFRDRWYLLEVKNPAKPRRDRSLRSTQKSWIARQRATVTVVHTPEQALAAIGAVLPAEDEIETWRRLV